MRIEEKDDIARIPALRYFRRGQERLLTWHVLERVRERGISVEWIEQTISDPVAVVNDERKNSTNYFGVIENRRRLLRVAVSKRDDRMIVTAHFDTGSTRRHLRGDL